MTIKQLALKCSRNRHNGATIECIYTGRNGFWAPFLVLCAIWGTTTTVLKEIYLAATFFIERVERSMRRIVEYDWQDALQNAVHERDPREIEGRVLRAEIAIFERVHSPCRLDSIETQALFDALKVLRLLRSSVHRATKSAWPINSQRKSH